MNDDKRTSLRVMDDLKMRGFDDKREYVNSLEGRDDEQALSLLVECLCDESAYLRDLAEKALIRKGSSCADVLLPHLTQGLWYTRAAVANVLGSQGCKDALPGLQEMSGDANRAVAEAALDAIIRIAAAGHAVSAARTLNHVQPILARRALDQGDKVRAGLATQLQRLMSDRELMQASDDEVLREDVAVAEAQENLEWEVLTGRDGSKKSSAEDEVERTSQA